ncbi:MAG TPA: hypothetical protein VKT82_01675 [Ktedonobacterales bacterium]|nr:hypothetical protein [Ktedonobacterales bacterium]
MPIDWTRYPPTWFTKIRPAILRRAGQRIDTATGLIVRQARCEWCQVENGSTRRGTRIILTIAHLGAPVATGTGWQIGNPHDKFDIRADNLCCLCQRCHLFYDLPDHMQHAAEGRARKRQKAGQLALFEVDVPPAYLRRAPGEGMEPGWLRAWYGGTTLCASAEALWNGGAYCA